jgi:hypothetical protein
MDASEISAWYNILSEKLMGVSQRFVFNVDQTGCSEYIDSYDVTIMLPIDYPDRPVTVPVNCPTKRSMLTAYIAADGYRMKRFLGVGVSLASQENVFITKSFFEL